MIGVMSCPPSVVWGGGLACFCGVRPLTDVSSLATIKIEDSEMHSLASPPKKRVRSQKVARFFVAYLSR